MNVYYVFFCVHFPSLVLLVRSVSATAGHSNRLTLIPVLYSRSSLYGCSPFRANTDAVAVDRL